MVNEVNKLIYNTIIKRYSINLPDIGTICVVRYPAEISSKRELTAPRYNVELSTNKAAISIVDIIASEASVEANRATEIYSRWLEKSRQNNQFVIDRVGTIRDKRIDADKELITALNTYNKSYTMSRRNNRKPVWILLSLVVAVLIYIGAWKMLNSNSNNDVIDTIEEVRPNIETTLEKSKEVDAIEDVTPIESQQLDWRKAEDIRHWVIVGSYSTIENAERAISAIEKSAPEVQCDCFELGSMYAVAAYGDSNLDKCNEFRSSHKDLFPQSWIYTPKRYR